MISRVPLIKRKAETLYLHIFGTSNSQQALMCQPNPLDVGRGRVEFVVFAMFECSQKSRVWVNIDVPLYR